MCFLFENLIFYGDGKKNPLPPGTQPLKNTLVLIGLSDFFLFKKVGVILKLYIRWCEVALKAAISEAQSMKKIDQILKLIEEGKEDHDEKYMSFQMNSAYISQETFRVNDIPYVSNQGCNLKAKIMYNSNPVFKNKSMLKNFLCPE